MRRVNLHPYMQAVWLAGKADVPALLREYSVRDLIATLDLIDLERALKPEPKRGKH